jgi:alkylation response protein AidB-like acyl-CoA dehydrogenase
MRKGVFVDIDLGPQYVSFRAEIRRWIEANTPPGLKGLANWGWQPIAGGRRGASIAQAVQDPTYREWERRLVAERLVCAQWPEEYGGRGWDPVRSALFNEELRRQGVPAVRRGMGEALVGPAVIVHGTPEQRAHFLARIVSGDDV